MWFYARKKYKETRDFDITYTNLLLLAATKKNPEKGNPHGKNKGSPKKKKKKKAANVARLYLDGSSSLAVAPSYTFLFATKI